MKAASDNSPLDIFIKETLKSADLPDRQAGANLPPVDWSEVEVLLRHEQKSIPVEVNRKTIVYAAAAVVFLLLIFGIFKIAQHYSELPPEPETTADTVKSTFAVMDTVKPLKADTVVVKADTVKPDTSHLAINPPKIDSSGVNKSNKKPDSGSVASRLMPDSTWIRRIHEKQDKKKKQNTAKDTAPAKPIIVVPPVDTASLHPVKEIKIAAPASTDTAGKNSTAPQSGSKKKKNKKTSNPPTTETPKSIPPVEVKSDSLK